MISQIASGGYCNVLSPVVVQTDTADIAAVTDYKVSWMRGYKGPSRVPVDFKWSRSGSSSLVSYLTIFTEHFRGMTAAGLSLKRRTPATFGSQLFRSTRF